MKHNNDRTGVVDRDAQGGHTQTAHMTAGRPRTFTVATNKGGFEPLNFGRMRASIAWASRGYEDVISADLIVEEALKNVFDKIATREIEGALILAAVSFIEQDPAYGYVAARLLKKKLYKEITGASIVHQDGDVTYRTTFVDNIHKGVAHNVFDKRLLEFDVERLSHGLHVARDELFDFMGIKTLYSISRRL